MLAALEVEANLRGITPHIVNKTIVHVTIRQPKLRWSMPANLYVSPKAV